MILSKKDQYFKIISEKENKKYFNGFMLICNACFSLSTDSSSDSNVSAMSIILLLAFILSTIVGFFFPFILFVFGFFFLNQEKYSLAIFSFIDGFSYIINLLGCFGKVKCFCLYRPCQWLFFMIIFDLIQLFSNIFVSISIMHKEYFKMFGELDGLIIFGFLGSLVISIVIIGMHVTIANKLNILFNSLRNLETNVIKFCVCEYIKELKSNQDLNKDNN